MTKGLWNRETVRQGSEVTSAENGNYNFLYAPSTVKDPRWNIGDAVVLPDGRVFRYALAGAGLNGTAGEVSIQTEFGVCVPDASITNAVAPAQTAQTNLPSGINASVGAVGDMAVRITIGATDGRSTTTPGTGTGLIAKDELRGGYVVLGNGGGEHPQFRGIVGNDAVAAGGGSCLVFLDAPLVTAVTATSTHCEAYLPLLGNVRNMNVVGSAYVTCVGFAATAATYGQYFWVQTEGPVWATSDFNTGKAAHGRDVYVATNGSVVTATSTTYAAYQKIGTSMDLSASGTSNGPCIWLSIGF
jgi:hypothetical protein